MNQRIRAGITKSIIECYGDIGVAKRDEQNMVMARSSFYGTTLFIGLAQVKKIGNVR
jgi:hypothetical protein